MIFIALNLHERVTSWLLVSHFYDTYPLAIKDFARFIFSENLWFARSDSLVD